VPVTLKMRLGWDDASRNAPELARIAADLGVAMITVHGRTRCQFYKGEADWSAVAAVRDAVDLPLVVNGDIASADDAREALIRSGADAVMVGRACQGRPWLPGQIARGLSGEAPEDEPDLPTRRSIALEHFEAMIDHHGVELGVRCFRKHFAWYVEGLSNEKTARARINSQTDPDEVRQAVAEAFDEARELAEAA
jgi:tRNA-dihydrouridine synthase B